MNKNQIEEEVRLKYSTPSFRTHYHTHTVSATTVGELLDEIKSKDIPNDADLSVEYDSDNLKFVVRRQYSEEELEVLIQHDINRKTATQKKQITEATQLLKTYGYTVEAT